MWAVGWAVHRRRACWPLEGRVRATAMGAADGRVRVFVCPRSSGTSPHGSAAASRRWGTGVRRPQMREIHRPPRASDYPNRPGMATKGRACLRGRDYFWGGSAAQRDRRGTLHSSTPTRSLSRAAGGLARNGSARAVSRNPRSRTVERGAAFLWAASLCRFVARGVFGMLLGALLAAPSFPAGSRATLRPLWDSRGISPRAVYVLEGRCPAPPPAASPRHHEQ